MVIMRTSLCVHMWSVHMQIHLTCCVYAGSFMEFQCFEVNPEDDSKDITGCPNDDKPSTGMLASSVLLLILIMFSVFWLFWLSCQYLPSNWLERPSVEAYSWRVDHLTKPEYYILLVHVRQPRMAPVSQTLNCLLRLAVVMFSLYYSACQSVGRKTEKLVTNFFVTFLLL